MTCGEKNSCMYPLWLKEVLSSYQQPKQDCKQIAETKIERKKSHTFSLM